jgi:16S rRNA (adenine1518-N6/adenine1519-N6)-dimethyltransferase
MSMVKKFDKVVNQENRSSDTFQKTTIRNNISPRKAFGQNFLIDRNIVDIILETANADENCDILEIGPGTGSLTQPLLKQARTVTAIECDPRCIEFLQDMQKEYGSDKFILIKNDILKVDIATLFNKPYILVANLPYYISTKILVRLLTENQSWPPLWQSLTLMFQQEVAHQITAQSGTPDYGKLSILTQWLTDARIVLHIPPHAFHPQPKVHSSVVHIVPLKEPRFPAPIKEFSHTIATAFSQRRKMLRVSLKSLFPDICTTLCDLGISEKKRAEQVTIEEYCRLARHLTCVTCENPPPPPPAGARER